MHLQERSVTLKNGLVGNITKFAVVTDSIVSKGKSANRHSRLH